MPDAAFLTTERLSLRPVEEDDLDFLMSYLNSPAIRRYRLRDTPMGRQEIKDRHLNTDEEWIYLMICHDAQRVGRLLLHLEEDAKAEIGIWIVPEEQGQGYATEASRRVIDYVFNELNRHKIVARTFSSNEPSKRIWEKLGFEHEATLHEEYFNNGDFRDVHYYSLLEQDHD